MSQKPREFVARSRLPVPAAVLLDWHVRPGAFERLNPPWAPAKVLSRTGGVTDGGRVTLQVKLGGLPIRWELEHAHYDAGSSFLDRQVRGPFARWEHVHRVIPDGPQAAWLEDHITYEMPAGALGGMVAPALLRERLAATFAFRHRQTARDLIRQQSYRGAGPLTVVVSGASGLIGRALTAFLGTAGHRVRRLVRGAVQGDDIGWDPAAGRIDRTRLEGVDAVVHLAGENVSARRWTPEQKARIRESRVAGTSLLADAVASLPRPPRVMVSASGINIYGPHTDEDVDESTPLGKDFLAEVATAWEAAAAPAAVKGIRVAHPRFAAVLDPADGALARYLTPFRAGVGGPLGSGKQPFSWVALDDVVGALHHALVDESLDGPFNVASPAPLSQAAFANTLAQVLKRPAVLPVPAFALRALFGDMADAMILTGARVLPRRLLAAGFRFLHPELAPALREMLGKSPVPALKSEGARDQIVLAADGGGA
jgi:uncharacterized protein